MPKLMYTQGLAVLLAAPVNLDALRECLSEAYTIVRETEAAEHWAVGGPSLVVEYRSDVHGYVWVDVAPHPWPDDMGNPQAEPTIFATWSTGGFGPFAFPGGLSRATQQSWRWENALAAVGRHTAFARIRTSYILGAGEGATVAPKDCNPVDELDFITGIAQRISGLPEAICYFNPNGEVLLPANELNSLRDTNRTLGLPDLDVWCNIRMFNLEGGWRYMDTVGNGQLDMTDLEAAFPEKKFRPQDIDRFLRNASLYILRVGSAIGDGDTMSMPGGTNWQAHLFEEGLSSPPRSVVRLLPVGAKGIPGALLPKQPEAEQENMQPPAVKGKPWWKKW
jgi:hypothetical protein